MCGCWSRAVVLISVRKRSAPSAAPRSGCEDLDGDVAIVPQVVGEVDGRHAAGAELAIDAIAIGECGLREAWSRIGHCDFGAPASAEEGYANMSSRRTVGQTRRRFGRCSGWGARGGTVLRGPVQYCRHCPAILPRLRSGQSHPLASASTDTAESDACRRARMVAPTLARDPTLWYVARQ